MNLQTKSNINPESNITKTGYRALFVLMKLLKSSYSRDELIAELQKDEIINRDLSKDTVTYTINTLKKAGCIISRPTQRTSNKYILKSHPFNILLKEEQIYALQTLRESIATLGDWKLLIYLNNLYIKIAKLAPDEKTKELLMYKHPLRGVDYKILNELMLCIKRSNEHINICYKSPQYGEEFIDFAPKYITFENEKLYVWGHSQKYDAFSYLRVDRITRVNSVTFSMSDNDDEEKQKSVIVVDFKLKGYSALVYSDNEHEKILSYDKKEEYPLMVRAFVTNEFNFYQRLMSFGTDCLIISPDSAREEYLKRVRKICTRYENE